MASRVVGYGCVALLGFAVWASRHGDMGFSLIALALAFALLLASLALLRARENRL